MVFVVDSIYFTRNSMYIRSDRMRVTDVLHDRPLAGRRQRISIIVITAVREIDCGGSALKVFGERAFFLFIY